MNAAQLAADVLGVDTSELYAERIKRGLTNESWRVRGGGHDVIVRISTVDEHALQLDRVSEANVLRIVEQAGIGAAVLKCEPQARLLITRALPGRDWDAEQASVRTNISRLATLIKRLHALPLHQGIHRIALTDALRGYWSELDAKGLLQSEQQLQRRNYALHVAQSSDREPWRCLCHTDLHHYNIVDNGEQLWIVDWEYAGIGDLYFDLASFCCWHRFDNELRRTLLLDYFGEANEQMMLRLEQMCWLFDYIKELWFAVRRV